VSGIEIVREKKCRNRTLSNQENPLGNLMGLGEAQERGLGILPQQSKPPRRDSLDRRVRVRRFYGTVVRFSVPLFLCLRVFIM